jgi:hypothetical protein
MINYWVDLVRRVLRGELTLSSVFALSSNNAILSIIQSATPRLTVLEKDVRKDLELLLTQTMESFIVSTTQSLLDRLLAFVTQASAHVSAGPLVPLRSQSFASPTTVAAIAAYTREVLHRQLPLLQRQLHLYLATHHAVRSTLAASIKTNLVDSLDNFNSLVRREYPTLSPGDTDTNRLLIDLAALHIYDLL